MTKVALVLGAAGLATALVSLKVALEAGREAEEARTGASQARRDLDAARTEIEEVRRETAAAAEARKAAEERVAALETRLAALAAASPAGSAPGAAPGGTAAPSVGTAAPRGAGHDPGLASEYQDLRKRVFKGDASPDEQKRFWELVKVPGLLDGILSDMEAAVASSPEDLAARMELSQAYISKLFTVPPGPEMGTWAAKAEGQWKEVLTRDDRHWEARVALATSYARYPEFLNKTADAIREFETARRQQETGPAKEEQSRVYMELGNLYKRAGNPTKQREVLEEGRRRHPEDDEIRKAIEVLDAR